METPVLTNTCNCIVAHLRRDPSNVLEAINFTYNAYAAGNRGFKVYARALAVYFWIEGDKTRASQFARM